MAKNPTDIDILNQVTQTLIDSHKGYEMAYQMIEDHEDLRTILAERSAERLALVARFQNAVVERGGEPETNGTPLGVMHRGVVKVSRLFQSNLYAALTAIDDGEIYLMDEVEDRLKLTTLSPETRHLLNIALDSAIDGDAFAGATAHAA